MESPLTPTLSPLSVLCIKFVYSESVKDRQESMDYKTLYPLTKRPVV